MIPIYQTIVDVDKGNCQQAAIASLLELPIEEVPNFKEFGDLFWSKCINFVLEKGYEFDCFIYNNRLRSLESYDTLDVTSEYNRKLFVTDIFEIIKKEKGVKGYFCAGVYSPKYFDPYSNTPTTHAVIIDKDFNIVNPINKEYIGINKFPLHNLLGYNGILDIMIINEK